MNLSTKTHLGNVDLRPMSFKDIPYQLDYLYNSPKKFLEEIGFDTTKLPGRGKHEEGIKNRLEERGLDKFQSVVAEFEGKIIAITNLQLNDTPKAHFHILDNTMRGKGLGKPILINSLKILMEQHNLTELLIEPKVDNQRMNNLMTKCGFNYLGETTFSGPITFEFKAASYKVELKSLI